MLPICFVTGATGFVGANLMPLLARRYRLRCLVRAGSPGTAALTEVPYEAIPGALDDEMALRAGVHGADLVVHLAALVSFRRQDRAAMFRINADATATLAQLARAANVRRFLHCSTISAVGYSDTPRELDETAPYNFGPLRIGYSDSKHAAEQAVLAEAARGLDAVIVNPPSMYGQGDRRKAEGSLLDAVLQGRIRLAPPGGLNVADVLAVCQGMLLAIERGRTGERYLLGGENLRGQELLARIAAHVGGQAPRRTVPAWLLRAAAGALGLQERLFGSHRPVTREVLVMAPRFLWFSSRKAERELGYRPTSVDPGIRAAAEFLRTRA